MYGVDIVSLLYATPTTMQFDMLTPIPALYASKAEGAKVAGRNQSCFLSITDTICTLDKRSCDRGREANVSGQENSFNLTASLLLHLSFSLITPKLEVWGKICLIWFPSPRLFWQGCVISVSGF